AATLSAQAFFVSGRDRRWQSTTGRTFQRAGTDVGTTFGVPLEQQVWSAGPDTNFVVGIPVVLKPGDDLLVISQNANISLSCNFRWRERVAFSGELPA